MKQMSVLQQLRLLSESANKTRPLISGTRPTRGMSPFPPPSNQPFPPDMQEYNTLNEALAGLVDREFLKTQRYQQQQHRANRNGAHPKIILFEAKLRRKLADMGVPMFCHTMVRTREQQQIEYNEGTSKDSPADGLWPHRKHAIDMVHSTRAWSLTPKQWQCIGHVGFEVAKANNIAIVWGGDDPGVNDSFNWDPAHWELAKWKTLG